MSTLKKDKVFHDSDRKHIYNFKFYTTNCNSRPIFFISMFNLILYFFNTLSSRHIYCKNNVSLRLVFLFYFVFIFSFYVHFCFVIFIQLKTEDEENDLELRDTNGKSDVKSDDMVTETTAITENGQEILMTVVNSKTDGNETSPTPANHQQVFWIQSGSHPPPPSLYTIKQLNYSQVISFLFYLFFFSYFFQLNFCCVFFILFLILIWFSYFFVKYHGKCKKIECFF